MRAVVVLLIVLVGLGATLYALGIFDPGPGAPVEGDEYPGPGRGQEGAGAGGLRPPPPPEMPEREALPLPAEVQVLLLVEFPQRFNVFLAQQWGGNRRVKVFVWAPPRDEGPSQIPLQRMTPHARLIEEPSPAFLDGEGIDVVALCDLVPGALPSSFWAAVAERVRDGRIGLLVQPGVRTVHRMLDHEVLGPLLPVLQAAEDDESGVKGAYPEPATFAVTAAGERHPASRIVAWEKWSREFWKSTASGERPWGSRYVAPVTRLAEGAQALLVAEAPRRDGVPALVAGPRSAGRVLWVGHWDLGETPGYGHPPTVHDWNVYVTNWIVWLSGRAE
jgi:hypothetical protein